MDEFTQRVIDEANYFISTKGTVRQTAKIYGLSKSTIHIDLSKRLKYIDADLYDEVKEIMDKNFAEKHIRGGYACSKKYNNISIEAEEEL